MNILDYCIVDVERSKDEQANVAKKANDVYLMELGKQIAANVDNAVAQDMAVKARDTFLERNKPYTWYVFSPASIYPAAIQYITDNRATMAEYFTLSDSQLINHAMNGDQLARFVVSARQNASEALAVDPADWELTMQPRDSVTNPAQIERRALALYIAQRFFKEMLHQAVNGIPIGVKITKDEAWRQ